MAAAKAKTRVTCPHCGRSIALRPNGLGIARHGRLHRPACPGSRLTPVDGPLTDRQLDFIRHCWQTGDALPVARVLGTAYTPPDIAASVDADRVDEVLAFLVEHAREWVLATVRDYRQGVAA